MKSGKKLVTLIQSFSCVKRNDYNWMQILQAMTIQENIAALMTESDSILLLQSIQTTWLWSFEDALNLMKHISQFAS